VDPKKMAEIGCGVVVMAFSGVGELQVIDSLTQRDFIRDKGRR